MSRSTTTLSTTLNIILLVFTKRQLCITVAIGNKIVCRIVNTNCGKYGEYMIHPATATECIPK
jgi:hypothetical protein